MVQAEITATTAHEQITESMTRVHDLRDRIGRLKVRFNENKIKVELAAEAVQAANELASRAEQVTHTILTIYKLLHNSARLYLPLTFRSLSEIINK